MGRSGLAEERGSPRTGAAHGQAAIPDASRPEGGSRRGSPAPGALRRSELPQTALTNTVSPERVLAASCLARCSPRPASGLIPAPYKSPPLCWGSEHVTCYVRRFRRESLFPTDIKLSCMQATNQSPTACLQDRPSLQAPRAREMRVGRTLFPLMGHLPGGAGLACTTSLLFPLISLGVLIPSVAGNPFLMAFSLFS